VTAESNPFNYRYFVDHATINGGRVLDYGCGLGQIIALGMSRGLDIWGADTFEGYYAGWSNALTPEVRDRVRHIADGRADFPDAHFDLVLNNQVLEHITNPEATIADICRLLRPGGTVIAAFPVADTWYEGHVGLYFAHWFGKGSLRETYFTLSRRLGFGLYYPDASRAEWAKLSAKTLDDVCFYYPRRRMWDAFEKIFATPIEDMAVDYMRTRLGTRAQYLPAVADPLLRLIYHKRAGEILKVRKPGP
jgi:SAM-dependent methyltransferase